MIFIDALLVVALYEAVQIIVPATAAVSATVSDEHLSGLKFRNINSHKFGPFE